MKTIRHLATLVAVPFMLATSINANAAYEVVDSFTSADMGFEDESTGDSNPSTGWWTMTTDWSRSTDQAASGNASLCFAATDLAAGANTWAQATINIAEAGTYRFRMQVYVDANCNDGLSVIALNVKEYWRSTSVNIVGTKGEWVTIESNDMAFTEDELGDVTMIVKLGTTATGDILFYIDDVELIKYVEDEGTDENTDTETEPEVDTEDILSNRTYAGFETAGVETEGGATGWWTGSSANWQRSTEQAANGSTASLCFSGDETALATGPFVQTNSDLPVVLSKAGLYNLGFYIYIDPSANDSLSSILCILTTSDWHSYSMPLTDIEKGVWTYVEHEFDVKTAQPSVTLRFKMDTACCSEGSALIYLDDMSLKYAGESTATEDEDDEDDTVVEEDTTVYKLIDTFGGTTLDMDFEGESTGDQNPSTGWWAFSTNWARTTEMASSGSASLCVSGTDPSQTWIQGTAAVEEVGTYKITADVFVDASCNESLSGVNFIFKSPWLDNGVSFTDIAKGEWVTVETAQIEITDVIESTDFLVRLSATFGDVLFYIDNIKLYKALEEGEELEEDDDTGMATTDAATVDVGAKDGAITIAGVDNGTTVEVYAVTGVKVATAIASESTVSIPATSGIYIVKVGANVVKVAL